jgi:hypothetical protein
MKNTKIITLGAVVSYIVMVVVNVLAVTLPINGIATDEVSNRYANLFAPAGVTFSIWGLIYLALGVFLVYCFFQKNSLISSQKLNQINIYFIISSLINAIWIFAWHHLVIWLTVILMLGLLLCLIKIANILNSSNLSLSDKLLVKVPFGIYFGWITIATIANITTFLVSVNFHDILFKDVTWTILILIVGLLIGSWRTIKDKNIAYGLVLIWAYFGIWLKHTSTSPLGYNSAYPAIITTLIISMAILVLINTYLVYIKKAL